jgi:sugar phosphate isomerase/epimerase
MQPDYDAFAQVQPYLANVHLKDYAPDDPAAPWRPLGRGTTPWKALMAWLVGETELGSLTIETHCEPLLDCSEESLETARHLLDDALRAVRADASNA